MFSWLQKDIPIAASVFFRGTWPCHKQEFLRLMECGIEISEITPDENAIWAFELKHSDWGEAKMVCFREFPMPPPLLVDWDADLIDSERADIKACGTAVNLMVNSRRKHLLRDRKNALFFLDAVMGEEGVAALDHVSEKFWSRAALKSEVSHSADVDVQSLFTLHFVREGDRSGNWLHTHGLARIGLLDFDILDASDAVASYGSEPLRAVASSLLEGNLQAGGDLDMYSGQKPIRAVPASEFMALAASKWTSRRDADENHMTKRVVLCDLPAKKFFGLWGNCIEPSTLLSKCNPDEMLIHFSTPYTELMAERARSTFPLFASIVQEFADYDLPRLVKIGYPVDGGAETQREHLWFGVHTTIEDSVDATLVNQPFHIARMKAGERGIHPINKLSDWQIMTPCGPINPRQTRALRLLREMIASAKIEKKGNE